MTTLSETKVYETCAIDGMPIVDWREIAVWKGKVVHTWHAADIKLNSIVETSKKKVTSVSSTVRRATGRY